MLGPGTGLRDEDYLRSLDEEVTDVLKPGAAARVWSMNWPSWSQIFGPWISENLPQVASPDMTGFKDTPGAPNKSCPL